MKIGATGRDIHRLEMATIARKSRLSREKRHETILRKACRRRACVARRLGLDGAGRGGTADRDALAGI
jgi:hypothetical protein